MEANTASVETLVTAYKRGETLVEVFEAIEHDSEKLGLQGWMLYGVDACDMNAFLSGRRRQPKTGMWEVPLPLLWERFFQVITPEDRVRAILPPAAILEYFEGVLWRAEGIRRRFPRLKEMWVQCNDDLDQFERAVERAVPGLMNFVMDYEAQPQTGTLTCLHMLRKLWRAKKLVPIEEVLGQETLRNLKPPPQLNIENGLKWLRNTRRGKVHRSKHAGFHDLVDMLNLKLFASASRAFTGINAAGYMTSPGWYTRQAFVRSWQGKELASSPFRHSAIVTTLLMSRRLYPDEQGFADYIAGGILLLKHICTMIGSIRRVRDALDNVSRIDPEERVEVPLGLEAAANYWQHCYFCQLYEVPPEQQGESREVDRVVSLVERSDPEEKAESIFQAVQKEARDAADDGIFLDFEVSGSFIPTRDGRAREVLEWLGRA